MERCYRLCAPLVVLTLAVLVAPGSKCQANREAAVADAVPVESPERGDGVCEGRDPVPGRPRLAVQTVVSGLQGLTDIAFPPGDPSRLFVTEQHSGAIRIVKNGSLVGRPFLELADRISFSWGFEQGLLGLAFHPKYQENRRFFTFHTDVAGASVVTEFLRHTSDPELAAPDPGKVLLSVPQPEANHNGGGLRFGPDGYLYVTLGDGGGAGDSHGPSGNGQNKKTLLGKMLRIDVDSAPAQGKAYAIPPTNPFVSDPDFLPEIYHWGLRNPWRFSFDRDTGDMWIGDVGQDKWEEMDFVPAGKSGLNFGWRCFEGFAKFKDDPHCKDRPFVSPVLVKAIDGDENFCSIISGFRYRGCLLPGYQGVMFYGDWCADHIRMFEWDGKQVFGEAAAPANAGKLEADNISSWAEDSLGDLYFVTTQGLVARIVPHPGA